MAEPNDGARDAQWREGLAMGKTLGLGEAARLAREEYRATGDEALRKFAIKLGNSAALTGNEC